MDCRLSDGRQFGAPLRENVHDGVTSRDEIVRNNAAMTSPPRCFRAHDGASLCMSCLTELAQSRPELVAHRVVGIVMKAFVVPEAIDGRRNAPAAAQAS